MHIDRMEVLRYLGYKHQYMDEKFEKLLTECIAEMSEALRKSFVYNVYDIKRDGDKMALKDTNLTFQSKDLSMHLHGSDKCALMAATLGLEADRRITYYSKTDLTRGIVMDACASAAIEALCDEVQEEIRLEALKEGYCCTSRYSPGYGDLPITLQKGIIELLKAYPRIGLTVNESSIMLPRKSVTAFAGWQTQEGTSKENKCSRCKDKNCIYRKCGSIDD